MQVFSGFGALPNIKLLGVPMASDSNFKVVEQLRKFVLKWSVPYYLFPSTLHALEMKAAP
eukprot:234768-Amphidinium_carterae.1